MYYMICLIYIQFTSVLREGHENVRQYNIL